MSKMSSRTKDMNGGGEYNSKEQMMKNKTDKNKGRHSQPKGSSSNAKSATKTAKMEKNCSDTKASLKEMMF